MTPHWYVFSAGAPRHRDLDGWRECRAVDEGVAELGILVEDEWQRRGVGSELLREIVAYAARTGLRALQVVHADDRGHWPWETGYRGVRGGQPVLGTRAPARRRAA